VATHARDNDLLDAQGWKLPGLKQCAKTKKRLVCLANQAKWHSIRNKPVFMCGFQVPRNHAHAMEMDCLNGNDRCRRAEEVELPQIDECDTFIDKREGGNPGSGCKKIRVHMVCAVNHDRRHKARLAAGGHLIETPMDSVCSSVVSMRGIRILTFIAELNEMEVWTADVGNTCLESFAQEPVFVVAGPEFREREGHVLVVSKALCGLESNRLRWHECFSDVLREMGFFPSKAERGIWMRDRGDHCECVAVCVDDLLIVSGKPGEITAKLE